MVQAWDPESMLAVEASTPPLDAAGHRAPLLTVPAFADALKRALEQEQQHQHQTQQEQEQGQGLWWDDDDPFGGLDDFGGMGIASPTCHPLAAPSAPDCGAGSSSTHNASTTSLGSSTASRPGTATPDIFAAPCAQQAPAAAVGEATTTTDDEEERDDEGLDIDIDDLHSLALPPTPPLALGHGLAPFAAPEPPVRPAAAAPSRLLVRFPGAATDAAAAQLKSAKQYLGPLACDPSIWASWGLPPHAWATFQRQVNADPAAVPAHVAALLAAARAGGSGLVAVEEQPEGNGAVLALPAGAARPAAVSFDSAALCALGIDP